MYFEIFHNTYNVVAKVEDEQDFQFQNIADSEMLKREFAVVSSYNPKESYPTALGITNVWATLKNKNIPRVDINFFFKGKRIETGKTIECTTNKDDECFLELPSARLKKGIPDEDVSCKLKIETEVSLDFSGSEPRPMWKGISFPSSLDKDSREGKPFALSVHCSDSKTIISGYFLQNTEVVPSL